MKITGMETIVVELPGRSSYTWRSLQAPIGRYVILRVTTDEGITGLGEAPALLSWGGEHGRYFGEDPHIVCYLVHECFAPMLVGTDPHELKRHFPRMDGEVRGFPYTKAMIESAVLDIVARRAGLPVHQLLGGAVRNWIPLCHSVGMAKPEAAADPIIVHPDVRRMLLTMRAYTEAGRAFAAYAGLTLDRAKYASDEDCQALSELLTPVAKAFLSDRGFECAVLAQQVVGGHGFVKEWGVEQIVRDARIAQIYEGTNGIQALDFANRKVCRDGGRMLHVLIDKMAATVVGEAYRQPLAQALARLRQVTDQVVERAPTDAALAGAISTDLLDLAGYTIYAWLWARMADAAGDDEFGRAKRSTANFFYARLLPKTLSLEASVLAGADTVMRFEEAAF